MFMSILFSKLFSMAETSRYLNLIFANNALISLNDWILITEAHLMPIKKCANGRRGPIGICCQGERFSVLRRMSDGYPCF